MELKQGQKNPLVEAASNIDIFAGRRQRDPREVELDEMRGPVVAEDWHDDPRIAPQAADPAKDVEASNPDGSFEAFLHMFGGPPPRPPEANGAEVNGSG